MLQLFASRLSPTQQAPPFDGGGLVQVLLRVMMPPSHFALHSLQSPKSLQPPSTAQQQMITIQTESKRDNANLITFNLICWSQDLVEYSEEIFQQVSVCDLL